MVLERPARMAARPLAHRDLPDPAPGPGEILVRIAACAVCRTDLHVIEGDLEPHRLPIVPGHQIVGRVEASGARTSRFQRGDRVGIAWLRGTCGACTFCRTGRENLCPGSLYTGWDADGGYAELAVVDERFAYAIPERFSDAEAAPLLCAGIIGYRALRRSRIEPGQRLGLYGFGSSAHIVAQIARHRGCEVYVATRDPSHRKLAEELGASWTGDTPDAPPAALDGAIVFAPAGDVVPPALRALGKGGTLAVAGIHLSDIPPLEYGPCLFQEKTLTSVTSNTRADGEELLREAAAIPLRPRVTTFGLRDANEALLALAHDGLRGTAVLVAESHRDGAP
jgi:propanol-preferring alcohol dehydrogenase